MAAHFYSFSRFAFLCPDSDPARETHSIVANNQFEEQAYKSARWGMPERDDNFLTRCTPRIMSAIVCSCSIEQAPGEESEQDLLKFPALTVDTPWSEASRSELSIKCSACWAHLFFFDVL